MSDSIFQKDMSSDETSIKSSCLCAEVENPANWKGYYPLEDCLRIYQPHQSTKPPEDSISEEECEECEKACPKKKTKYCIHGINILNRDSLEISHLEERMKRRKEQHTKVEKRRRTLINTTIEKLAQALPPTYIDHRCKNARGLILQQTLQYVESLQKEIAELKAEIAKRD